MTHSFIGASRAVIKLPFSALVLSLFLSLGMVACDSSSARTNDDGGAHATEPPPPAVQASAAPPGADIVDVRRQDVAEFLPGVGTLAPLRTTRIGPQVTARVEEVHVDVGAAVTKDQPLVQLDSSFFTIEVAQRRAELEAARVDIALTQLTLQRTEKLATSGNTTEQALDEARARHSLALAKVELATQGLRYAEKRLDECTVRAPYDGVITARFVDPGEPVATTPVTQLLEIQDVATLELLFTLPQRFLDAVHQGGPVLFRASVNPGLEGRGVIDEVYPGLDEVTRTIRCRVLVENKDMRFRPGMLMQVGVVLREAKNVIAVPAAAVTSTAGGHAVQVITDGGYEERLVKTGITSLTLIEITEGLAEGDRVLVFRTADHVEDQSVP